MASSVKGTAPCHLRRLGKAEPQRACRQSRRSLIAPPNLEVLQVFRNDYLNTGISTSCHPGGSSIDSAGGRALVARASNADKGTDFVQGRRGEAM